MSEFCINGDLLRHSNDRILLDNNGNFILYHNIGDTWYLAL